VDRSRTRRGGAGRVISNLKRGARRLVLPLRGRFRQSVEDPSAPLSFDMAGSSRTLLVAFGGMAGQIGMPPFEFFKATGDIPVKRLFVRDLHQAWYHRGIPGHGDTLEQAAESLRALISQRDVERLVVTGNSAGGYAALAFGSLLGADTALCFAPQTVLDPAVLAEWDDHRWDGELEGLIRDGVVPPRWTDLRIALVRGEPRTSFAVYFDETLEVDRLHADRLQGVAGVQLHRKQSGAHSVALDMRETGELEQVLHEALLSA
jgi:pimeloyl-ACP methyl ester carboxylesterase